MFKNAIDMAKGIPKGVVQLLQVALENMYSWQRRGLLGQRDTGNISEARERKSTQKSGQRLCLS